MIKAVIIDDEPAIQEVNARLLGEYFPNITLLGFASSIIGGTELIIRTKPDLVLLDIELSDGNGFQLLQKLQPYKFKVVFITGFDSFAIKAIKYSALDYILKPINEPEFQKAIQQAVELIEKNKNTQPQTEVLMDSFRQDIKTKKLVLRTADTLHIIEISDIYFCKSDNSYTTFYFKDNDSIIVSKGLKEYETLLSNHFFYRTHQRYLVNLNHINKVEKTDGGFIIMKNKKEIPVSSRQMKKLISMLSQL